MCNTYLSGIENQTLTVLDPWYADAIASVDALASLLDSVLDPSANPGGCANTGGNPTAIVLTPLPLTHFQVCGKTSACQVLCADSIQLFDFELQRVIASGANANAPPFSFDLSVESPFFNRYASATPAYGGTLLAIATLPAANATNGCKTRCGTSQGTRCMVTLLAPSGTTSSQAQLRVEFFCIPDPSMIMSSIFPTGIDSFTLQDSDTMQTTQVPYLT